MFPDLTEPVRMPSLFPVPTHIVKRQTVFTITPGTASIFGIWKPHVIEPTTIPKINEGYRSGFMYQNGISFVHPNNADEDIINNQSYVREYTPSLLQSTAGLVHGGARLIGAFIELEYIGTVEQHAGLIECGLHLHSANSAYDLQAPHLMTQSEIIQSPFYRKFKPMDGVRCVWFPIDEESFNFQDFDISVLDSGADAQVDTAQGRETALKQITLRQPTFPEWAINLTGLSLNQNIRVHMCSFYETVPDEALKDIYGAKKGSASASTGNLRGAINQAVQSEMIATPSKSSNSWGMYREKAMGYLNDLSQAYGLYQTVAPMIGNLIKFV